MTQNSSNEFIRGAAQATVEGILPRERHTPAPPAPAESGTAPGGHRPTVPPVTADPTAEGRSEQQAPVPPAEGIVPRERHTPAPPRERHTPSPSAPTAPAQPPTTPPVTPVDTTTGAPVGTTAGDGGAPTTDGAATPPTSSSEPSADEEIVTMERHTPAPPRPRD
ncbi:hypothetical protein ABZ714_14035 [Streptomyces sp. NPDC006798]|uniref:hypothetical protein n=1 Tax=Streptomyces sp. NPDC006798 TaxID=3155462 RepID=UPI0033EB555A